MRRVPFVRGVSVSFLVLVVLATVAHAGNGPQLGIRNPDSSVATTHFFHIADVRDDFPISTQAPIAGFESTSRVGTAAHTLTCVPDLAPGGPFKGDYHTSFGYATPSLIEYEEGEFRLYGERGLPFEALLDSASPWTLHWYLATLVPIEAQGSTRLSLDAPVLPSVAVHAWVREGEQISIGNEGYRSGALIAEGETVGNLGGALATSTTSAEGQVTWSQHTAPDGSTFSLYHFEVAMAPLADTITQGGFNVEVGAFLKTDACPGSGRSVMPNTVAFHTSDGNRPRLEWSVHNPLVLHYVHPQIIGGDLVVHTSANSPWGQYDLDPANATLALFGPDGPMPGLDLLAPRPRFNEHNQHIRDVDGTGLFVRFVDQPDGLYTILYRITTLAGAMAQGTVTIQLGDPNELTLCGATSRNEPLDEQGCFTQLQDDEGNSATRSTPGIPVFALLAAVAFAAVAARRRA